MRNSGETQQIIKNMDELIDGIQILYGVEVLTSGERKAAAGLVAELIEFKGEKALTMLRDLARGEIAADDVRKIICAPPY
jgi:hypothetical protein